jgi:hypothetical protein
MSSSIQNLALLLNQKAQVDMVSLNVFIWITKAFIYYVLSILKLSNTAGGFYYVV